jgi:hypothetical protein
MVWTGFAERAAHESAAIITTAAGLRVRIRVSVSALASLLFDQEFVGRQRIRGLPSHKLTEEDTSESPATGERLTHEAMAKY